MDGIRAVRVYLRSGEARSPVRRIMLEIQSWHSFFSTGGNWAQPVTMQDEVIRAVARLSKRPDGSVDRFACAISHRLNRDVRCLADLSLTSYGPEN